VFGQKGNTQQQQQQNKQSNKNPCRISELNPGPPATKVDALPLH